MDTATQDTAVTDIVHITDTAIVSKINNSCYTTPLGADNLKEKLEFLNEYEEILYNRC
jgi:hypothetical protein